MERHNNVLKFAEKGEAWAQTMMGDIYMNLDEHVVQKKVNKVKARKWYSLADEQDFPEAIYKCATLFDEEKKNPSRYYERLKKAAELGESSSAKLLAIHYWMEAFSGKGDEDCSNKVEYYASISLRSVSNANKQQYLSTIFGMTLSRNKSPITDEASYRTAALDLYRAKYYLEIGAKKNFDSLPSVPKFRSMMCITYANVLLQLGMYEYCGFVYEIPGYSFLPKMRYWANEAGGDKTAMKMVAGADEYGRGGRNETHCANCNVEASPGMKFKQCVRCKAAWCKSLIVFQYKVHDYIVSFFYSQICFQIAQRIARLKRGRLGTNLTVSKGSRDYASTVLVWLKMILESSC